MEHKMEHGMEHKCVSYPHLLCPNCWFRGNRRKLSATGKHSKASAPLVCLHGHSFMQDYAFHQSSPNSAGKHSKPPAPLVWLYSGIPSRHDAVHAACFVKATFHVNQGKGAISVANIVKLAHRKKCPRADTNNAVKLLNHRGKVRPSEAYKRKHTTLRKQENLTQPLTHLRKSALRLAGGIWEGKDDGASFLCRC